MSDPWVRDSGTSPQISTEKGSTATATAVLEVEDLAVTFAARGGNRPARAVDGVRLAVEKGEILALVGESGCGKTSLARAILGLVPPTRGRVVHMGNVLGYSAKALKTYRRSVQLVLQDPSGALNPRHTVYEAVAEGSHPQGAR